MSSTSSTDAVLRIRNLKRRFGGVEALRGVDLTLPRGAIYGFVGLNGAGKTTTLECALGLLRPHGGDISILGLPPGRIARSGGRLGVVFDSPQLPPNLTVRQSLEYTRIACGRRGRLPAEAESLLGLERWRSTRTRRLSLGNRRRLSIAQSLLGGPEVLLLDEPFAGLDSSGVDDLLALLSRLNREEGLSILLSSHQLHYVERISSHAGIIHEGVTAAEGRLEALLEVEGLRLRLRVDDEARALALLRGIEGVRSACALDGGRLEAQLEGVEAAAINSRLVHAGVAVSELVCERPSLATYFRVLVERRG
jgi:ABC-2 type transport system ATP-binding protein